MGTSSEWWLAQTEAQRGRSHLVRGPPGCQGRSVSARSEWAEKYREYTCCYPQNKNVVKMLGCDSTCRATSAEAGLKPKPVGAFSSSSTPLTPGLKWSSTWKRSSEERSFKEKNGDLRDIVLQYDTYLLIRFLIFYLEEHKMFSQSLNFAAKNSAWIECRLSTEGYKSEQALDESVCFQ